MDLTSIASGSSGNCICVGTEQTHVLIDAGISGKRIESGLNSIGMKTAEMDGILITHEHIDHVSGLGVVARRYGLPMYATPKTIEAIMRMKSVGNIDESLFHPICPDEEFTIGELTIHPMSISHDAADPVAYLMKNGEKSIGVVTDLGEYDTHITALLQGVDALLLEANHDVHMLEAGPYPYELKRRILSAYGHLSNESCGRLLGEVLHDAFQTVVLGHLSKENNYPQLAYEAVRAEVDVGDTPYHASDFEMLVANRSEPTQTVRV